MDVVILCGGMGSRLSEETHLKPKPMVEIGGKPILWHIMKHYSYYGYKRFILALGYKSEYIKNYFFNYRFANSDFSIKFDQNMRIKPLSSIKEEDWEVVLIDTGLNTLKGGRIKRVENYIKNDKFHLTYGDGISDVDIKSLVNFHNSHDKIATVTAVRPPSRFGEMRFKGDLVTNFEEKSQMNSGHINGGFFILDKKIFQYLDKSESCDFEFGPMQKLVKENNLMAFFHNSFWQCMDNIRERDFLDQLVKENKAPWIKW